MTLSGIPRPDGIISLHCVFILHKMVDTVLIVAVSVQLQSGFLVGTVPHRVLVCRYLQGVYVNSPQDNLISTKW